MRKEELEERNWERMNLPQPEMGWETEILADRGRLVMGGVAVKTTINQARAGVSRCPTVHEGIADAIGGQGGKMGAGETSE